MNSPTTALSTSSLGPFIGPTVLVIGGLAVMIISILLDAAVDGSLPIAVMVVGVIVGFGIASWRNGARWGRAVAWFVSVLLAPLSALALFVGVWGAGYYGSPTADLPALIGLPAVALVGSVLTLWTVLRPPTAG